MREPLAESLQSRRGLTGLNAWPGWIALRFYLDESIDGGMNLILGGGLVLGAIFTGAVAYTLSDFWLFAALLIASWVTVVAVPVVAGARLGAWWIRTVVRRARCRRIMRAQGWPSCLIFPRFLTFSDKVWGQLPEYDHFLLTGWSRQWRGGNLVPIQLYAALALLEELGWERRSGQDRLAHAVARVEKRIALFG